MARYIFAALAGLLLTTSSFALDSEAFTEERFEALQAEGALVLVDVWATWCPTCKRQREILADFQDQHPEVDFTLLEVDFDDQKDVVRQFRAPRQSTLALYRGEEQIWFSVAETREDVIFEELLNAAGESLQ